jgi:hypothetical protein
VKVVLKSNQCNITNANILDGSVREYAEALLVAIKETGLEVNDETKYVVSSRNQNSGKVSV